MTILRFVMSPRFSLLSYYSSLSWNSKQSLTFPVGPGTGVKVLGCLMQWVLGSEPDPVNPFILSPKSNIE